MSTMSVLNNQEKFVLRPKRPGLVSTNMAGNVLKPPLKISRGVAPPDVETPSQAAVRGSPRSAIVGT